MEERGVDEWRVEKTGEVKEEEEEEVSESWMVYYQTVTSRLVDDAYSNTACT